MASQMKRSIMIQGLNPLKSQAAKKAKMHLVPAILSDLSVSWILLNTSYKGQTNPPVKNNQTKHNERTH